MAKGKSQFETFARRAPEISVLADQPLSAEQVKELFQSDTFNFRYKLGPVYDILRHKNPKGKTAQMPTAVLITGDWGTGKTTAMKWLECLLIQWNKTRPEHIPKQEYVSVRPVWFYPWKYHTKQDVWRGLIAEVIANSIDVKNLTLKRLQYAGICIIKLLLKIVSVVVDSAKARLQSPDSLLSIEIGPGTLKKIVTEYNRAAHPEEAYRNKFEKALSVWIAKTMGKNERMVIFIDDLDRCMPEVALQVLEALKLYLNIPNLVFVLGVDKDVIEKLVVEHYRKLGLVKEKENDKEETQLEQMARQKEDRKARQYLSKMFQVEIELAPSQKQISDFFEEQLENLTAWDEWLGIKDDTEQNQRALFERLILKFARRNPRELKRHLNNAVMAGAGTRMMDLEDDENEPTFEQGLQLYFIREILREGYTLISDMINTDSGRKFFKDWSDLAIREADNQEFLEETPDDRLEREDSNLSDELRRIDPIYEQREYLQLLSNNDLQALVKIPFSEELAEFTSQAPLVISPKPAEAVAVAGSANVAVTDKQATSKSYVTVRDAIARQLNKKPEDVVPYDYAKVAKLDLSNTEISDLSTLSGLTSLQALNLSHTKFTDLEPIKHITNLERLYLSSTQVSNIEILECLVKIEGLWLDNTQVSELKPIARMKRLRTLSVSNTKVTDFGPISSLTNLEKLGLSNTEISKLEPIKELRNLRWLDINNTNVDDLTPVDELDKLEFLYASTTQIDNIHVVKNFADLKLLGITKTKVNDLEPIKELSKLESLFFSNTGVTNLEPIGGLTKLRVLTFKDANVSDLEPLRELNSLEILKAQNTPIKSLEPLKGLSNLREVLLLGCQTITVEQIKDLQKALPHCRILSALTEDTFISQTYRLFFNPRFPGLSKTKIMRFGKGGVILEGQNNNESSWRIHNGYLEMLDSEGKVHSRFYYNAATERFDHTNDPDTGSIRKHSIRGQYMLPTEEN